MLVRLDGQAKQGGFGLVAGEGANSDGIRRVEAVILHDNRGARFTGIVFAARDRPDIAPPHSSFQSDIASINA